MDIAQYHVAFIVQSFFLLWSSALEVILDGTGDTKKLYTFYVPYSLACTCGVSFPLT